MIRPVHAALAVAAILPIAVVAGCGGGSSTTTTSAGGTTTAPATTSTAPATETTTTATTTAATTAAGSTVQVAADPSGQLKFTQTALTATAGKVVIDFTNASQVPHNVTIQKAGTDQDLGATKTITASTATTTVTLPAGTYTFFCSVPGHEQAGMKGTLTVQ